MVTPLRNNICMNKIKVISTMIPQVEGGQNYVGQHNHLFFLAWAYL